MSHKVYIIGRDAIPEKVSLGTGESLEATLVFLPDALAADANLTVDCTGPGASVDLAGLYLCPSDEHFKLVVNVRHLSGECTSTQLFKGIVGGTSRAEFDGLVYVAPDAQKTKALQENHSILLSRNAFVETRPQLEIYADDVECSHGATTGFLSEDELFYMRSRGIPEADARRLQMLSFLAPVLNRLPEDLRAQIESLL